MLMKKTGALSRKDLQAMYNCCDKTMRKWLRDAGINHRKLITPLDFELLKVFIGEPRR